jgi:phosphoribosylformylglycinamidine synthase I
MRFGVVIFPGSNALDCCYVIDQLLGHPVSSISCQEKKLDQFDCVIIPGGFSYGDYLRAGAIAARTPVIDGIRSFAEKGGLVLGIGNGFQILLEAGLLPGAMLRNQGLDFCCHDLFLKVENTATPFTNRYLSGQVVKYPIAHSEGNFYLDQDELAQLEQEGRVIFRYCTPEGEVTPEANPNGSIGNVAGICSKGRNVLGLMPHPERCAEEILGNTSGRALFLSILDWWERRQQERVIANA